MNIKDTGCFLNLTKQWSKDPFVYLLMTSFWRHFYFLYLPYSFLIVCFSRFFCRISLRKETFSRCLLLVKWFSYSWDSSSLSFITITTTTAGRPVHEAEHCGVHGSGRCSRCNGRSKYTIKVSRCASTCNRFAWQWNLQIECNRFLCERSYAF